MLSMYWPVCCKQTRRSELVIKSYFILVCVSGTNYVIQGEEMTPCPREWTVGVGLPAVLLTSSAGFEINHPALYQETDNTAEQDSDSITQSIASSLEHLLPPGPFGLAYQLYRQATSMRSCHSDYL
jgi:hypothetical protein